MAVMLRSAAESAVCRILSFPINKRNNIYKRVRQAVRLGQPASFFAWNIALGDILTILMTQENVSRRSAWFSLPLMLFVSERFCSAKSANLLLFHHRVDRYGWTGPSMSARAFSITAGRSSGLAWIRRARSGCVRGAFHCLKLRLCGVQYLLADDDGGLYDGKGNPYVLR